MQHSDDNMEGLGRGQGATVRGPALKEVTGALGQPAGMSLLPTVPGLLVDVQGRTTPREGRWGSRSCSTTHDRGLGG